MHVTFSAKESLEESKDPILGLILSECELEAEITVGCELDERGAYLEDIEVDHISFHPPECTEAIKAGFLMNQALKDVVKSELIAKIQGRWNIYEELAWDWEMASREEAMERRFEEQRENC